jgi:hypothetical protein
MKPEVNAVLQEVKQSLAQTHQPAPLMPDFKSMSIMESTKWCLLEGGIDKPSEIAKLTGKKVNTINTALWKIRNPKRVKVLQRRAKKVKALKAGIIPTPKAKPTKIKKPTITNGQYADGMDTPYRDSIMRRGGSFVEPVSLEKARQWIAEKTESTSELLAENRRLKILVEHYEALLFKKGG